MASRVSGPDLNRRSRPWPEDDQISTMRGLRMVHRLRGGKKVLTSVGTGGGGRGGSRGGNSRLKGRPTWNWFPGRRGVTSGSAYASAGQVVFSRITGGPIKLAPTPPGLLSVLWAQFEPCPVIRGQEKNGRENDPLTSIGQKCPKLMLLALNMKRQKKPPGARFSVVVACNSASPGLPLAAFRLDRGLMSRTNESCARGRRWSLVSAVGFLRLRRKLMTQKPQFSRRAPGPYGHAYFDVPTHWSVRSGCPGLLRTTEKGQPGLGRRPTQAPVRESGRCGQIIGGRGCCRLWPSPSEQRRSRGLALGFLTRGKPGVFAFLEFGECGHKQARR